MKIISSDCVGAYRLVPLKTLLDSAIYLDKSLIETSGYYEWAIEKSALLLSKNKMSKAVWIDFSSVLWGDSSSTKTLSLLFDDIIDKKIKVKGVIDTSNHGHIGQYFFTLKEVCAVEVIN